MLFVFFIFFATPSLFSSTNPSKDANVKLICYPGYGLPNKALSLSQGMLKASRFQHKKQFHYIGTNTSYSTFLPERTQKQDPFFRDSQIFIQQKFAQKEQQKIEHLKQLEEQQILLEESNAFIKGKNKKINVLKSDNEDLKTKDKESQEKLKDLQSKLYIAAELYKISMTTELTEQEAKAILYQYFTHAQTRETVIAKLREELDQLKKTPPSLPGSPAQDDLLSTTESTIIK